jgi:hydrogenase expression/formation protein HypD
MKYLSDYRDPRAAQALLDKVRDAVTRPWTLMEVCGGQAHHLLRFGTDRAMPAGLELLHGPGCPVCATPAETVDRAVAVAAHPGVVFCTTGDVVRAPGRRGSLADVRDLGGDVRVVYSPLDALALARKHPERVVVFFAVGFETTAPTAAASVREADRLGLDNFALLAAHRRLAPAVEAVLDAPDGRAQAVLTAGHVASVTGLRAYEPMAARHRVPVVVTGSDPLDLLEGILRAVRQLEEGRHEVENQYARAVRPDGNPQALAAIDEVFEPADVDWPGLGRLPGSGLALREPYRRFDADARFPADEPRPDGCDLDATACGDVVAGRVRPYVCPAFGTTCTPDRPLGAPMVSAEGACAAYHRYRRTTATPVTPGPAHALRAAAARGNP